MNKLIKILFFDFKLEVKSFFIAGFIILLLCLPASKYITIIWGSIIVIYLITKIAFYKKKQR